MVVTYDGGVKLVDFGVAKVTAQAEVTRTGTLKGKLSYMSPEQCNNEPVDRRSDVFALGVLLFELTTRTRLFRTDSEAGTIWMVTGRGCRRPRRGSAGIRRSWRRWSQGAGAQPRGTPRHRARVQVALDEVARGRGLGMSSAALGEWLTATFGPKPEPWIGAPVSRTADVDKGNEATNVIRPPTGTAGRRWPTCPIPTGRRPHPARPRGPAAGDGSEAGWPPWRRWWSPPPP